MFDMMNSRGEYTNAGTYLAMALFFVYVIYNLFIKFFFDFEPYPTKMTDGGVSLSF